MRNTNLIRAVLLPSLILIAFNATSATADRQPIAEALSWVRSSPHQAAQYDYIMTARVRLLFFWAGKDDVGGGYIRRAVSDSDPHQEFFQVLFGSDPEKAPRAINRWGAGTEVAWHKDPVLPSSAKQNDVLASAFFGFMKGSKGKSASEMQEELKKEKEQGLHSFTGILSRVDRANAISLVVPLQSDTDFNLHQYAAAEPLMFENLGNSSRPLRTLQDASRCPRSEAFLGTIAEMMQAALDGQPAPLSRCYVYDAQENMLTVESIAPVAKLQVQLHGPNNTTLLDTVQENLLQLDFVSTSKLTGKQSYFSILCGTQGDLRGVPVQIRYQPNWWFQVILNLRPSKTSESSNTVALR
jgi:hypothetical protein